MCMTFWIRRKSLLCFKSIIPNNECIAHRLGIKQDMKQKLNTGMHYLVLKINIYQIKNTIFCK